MAAPALATPAQSLLTDIQKAPLKISKADYDRFCARKDAILDGRKISDLTGDEWETMRLIVFRLNFKKIQEAAPTPPQPNAWLESMHQRMQMLGHPRKEELPLPLLARRYGEEEQGGPLLPPALAQEHQAAAYRRPPEPEPPPRGAPAPAILIEVAEDEEEDPPGPQAAAVAVAPPADRPQPEAQQPGTHPFAGVAQKLAREANDAEAAAATVKALETTLAAATTPVKNSPTLFQRIWAVVYRVIQVIVDLVRKILGFVVKSVSSSGGKPDPALTGAEIKV